MKRALSKVAQWVRRRRFLVGSVMMVSAAGGFLHVHYRIPIRRIPEQLARVIAAPILDTWYAEDLEVADTLHEPYAHGRLYQADCKDAWRTFSEENHAVLTDVAVACRSAPPCDIPFVHERLDDETIVRFRETYHLRDLVLEGIDEYEAMLAVGAWVGTRWDHGSDPISGGSKRFDPSVAVATGEAGARYWCEIAARTMVHAATALGWSARTASTSRDGYEWLHTVCELWSNRFDKWFILDTDFNIVYESGGVPLSAFELCHRGPELAREGLIVIRRIAPRKPSLPDQDLLPFYAYTHLDMRSDWIGRPLRRGSPAGGDRNTWWTARRELLPVLNAMHHVDQEDCFNWPMNHVQIHPLQLTVDRRSATILLEFSAFSPRFEAFQVRGSGGSWQTVEDCQANLTLATGRNTLEARILLASGFAGPSSVINLVLR